MDPRVTLRQAEVLRIINDYIELHGYPPSLREIRDRLRVSAHTGVRDHLNALVRKGCLEYDKGVARGIRMTKIGLLKMKAVERSKA